MIKTIHIFFLSLFISININAQENNNDFCEAIKTIMNDAPNHFHNIRGKNIGDNMKAVIYNCMIPVPGVISSRFVYSNGNFYEGAIYQTQNIKDIKAYYDTCKTLFDNCIIPMGYSVLQYDNFYKGCEAYKKIVYLPKLPDGTPSKDRPAHVAIEVTYSKEKNIYTLVAFIFEH